MFIFKYRVEFDQNTVLEKQGGNVFLKVVLMSSRSTSFRSCIIRFYTKKKKKKEKRKNKINK